MRSRRATSLTATTSRTGTLLVCYGSEGALSASETDSLPPVLYHQPEKMNRTKEDLDARKENLERLKKQHGID